MTRSTSQTAAQRVASSAAMPGRNPPGSAPLYPDVDASGDDARAAATQGDASRPLDEGPSPGSLADGLKEAASITARAIKEQASAVAGEVGHELGKTAEAQAARGADAIRVFARAVDAAGAELKDQSPEAARYAAAGAEKIRSLSDDLASREAGQLMDAANDFARTQPIAFFGAAIAAGFALGRFLKSSARTAGSPGPRRKPTPAA